MNREALILGLALSLVGCEGSAPVPVPAPRVSAGEAAAIEVARPSEEGPLVVVLGDSIAAGLHLDPAHAFPALIQEQLAREDVTFRLVNAGVSGDTSAGGLRRLPWVLSQEPEVLVVELGGNDGLRGIPLRTIEQNLRQILDIARGRGIEVLLLGMRLPPNYGPEYTAGFAELYPRLARELDVDLVPFFMDGVGGRPDLNLPDGLHPNPEGHELLAETVAPSLKDILLRLPPRSGGD